MLEEEGSILDKPTEQQGCKQKEQDEQMGCDSKGQAEQLVPHKRRQTSKTKKSKAWQLSGLRYGFEKMRVVFLQLPLFEKKEPECMDIFDCWIYVLNNMEHLKEKAEGMLEVAKNLLSMDIPILQIIQATGLTQEQIKGLQN